MKKNRPFGQLNLLEILTYNSGVSVEVITVSTFSFLAMPIYCVALGVNPAWIGIAFMIPRLWDGISDPLVGYFSDNTRSPWGRRRPWLAIGSILAGVTYALTWCPPSFLGEIGLFIYFLVMSTLFYTFFTVFIVPFYALGNEITFDPAIRTKVMTWRNLIWGGVTLAGPWTYSMSFSPYFGQNEAEGVRIVGLLFGTFIVLCGLMPAIFTRENMAAQSQPKIHLFKAAMAAFRNKPFCYIAITRTAMIFGFTLIAPMIMYILTYYTFDDNPAAAAHRWGYIGMVFGIATCLAAPVSDPLVRKAGTKVSMMIALTMSLVGHLMWFFVLEPHYPAWVSVTPYILMGPGVTLFFAVSSIWLADVCDYDDLQNGVRREGVFSAVFSLIYKFSLALAAGVSGILVTLVGIKSDPGATQTSEALFNLRLVNAVLPTIFIGISIITAVLYPLNEKKMKEIKAALDKRETEREMNDHLPPDHLHHPEHYKPDGHGTT